MRSTLAAWLTADGGFEVIGEACDGGDAIQKAVANKPHIVLFDIDMPGLSCFEAARMIRNRVPETKVVFLSAFAHDNYIEQALACEARGYLTKGQSPQTISEAIRSVANGGSSFAPEVQSRLVIDSDGVRLGTSLTRNSLLTPRELEVLKYLANGMSKKEIASTMHLSVKTIDNHSTSLMTKLDIHDRVDLARYAIREGLIRA
ncbi:MAG: response regulator transcription factor [Planctomycetes bacterium]|nr:response regulator transcription factor [Planctomycetota bacterium]